MSNLAWILLMTGFGLMAVLNLWLFIAHGKGGRMSNLAWILLTVGLGLTALLILWLFIALEDQD